jgi:WD40 repeat protein
MLFSWLHACSIIAAPQVTAVCVCSINAIAVDAINGSLVTASSDRTARVWSIASGRCKHVLAGHGGTIDQVSIK